MLIGAKQSFTNQTLTKNAYTQVGPVANMGGAIGVWLRLWRDITGNAATGKIDQFILVPANADGTAGNASGWQPAINQTAAAPAKASVAGVIPTAALLQLLPVSSTATHLSPVFPTSSAWLSIHVDNTDASNNLDKVVLEVWPIYGASTDGSQSLPNFSAL